MGKVIEIHTGKEAEESRASLDELCRLGATRMLQDALESEVAAYLERHQGRGSDGHALVVRNGTAPVRKVTTGAGTLEVQAPRVDDRRDGEKFTSRILPPYMRRSPKVEEVLPILYLRGLSTGDFRPALESLLGKDAQGLSATRIAQMTSVWEQDLRHFKQRQFQKDETLVYLWADGIHFNIRLEEDRLCLLVLIGVFADGSKQFIAVEDGYRESTDSWRTVLCDLKDRGLSAPCLAIGDGALGFWSALREVFPKARMQRDWCHKMGNVLNSLPKRLQPQAKRLLREAMNAETKEFANEAIDKFVKTYEAKYPKATDCLTKDRDALLAYFDFPAEHWIHIRTTNVIESPFATVRLRTRVTKGSGSRTKGIVMAFKLLNMAEKRWRKCNAPHLLPDVVNGTVFVDGEMKKSQTEKAA